MKMYYKLNHLVSLLLTIPIIFAITSCASSKSTTLNADLQKTTDKDATEAPSATAAPTGTGAPASTSQLAPAVVSILPQGKDVKPNEKIKVTFNTEMNAAAVSSIKVTQNGAEGLVVDGKYIVVEGQWKSLSDKSYEFTPVKPFEPGSLIIITIPDSVKSADEMIFRQERNRYAFLIDDGIHKGFENKFIQTMKLENNGTHNIPMNITIPKNGGPFPVMFWVHGGGWNGGTVIKSEAEVGNQAEFLADHLGVAVVSVAYRCKGSNGNFEQAMKDVFDAVEYCKANSNTYNLDMTKIGFYGGSAGTPLASLAAQKLTEAKLYIGYNGIYDFINIGKGNFERNTEKYVSDPKANSPINNLRNPPPATLLLHGTKDTTIDNEQSVRFADSVVKSGGISKVLLYNGEAHSFFQPKKLMEIPTLYEVKEFIKRYLIK